MSTSVRILDVFRKHFTTAWNRSKKFETLYRDLRLKTLFALKKLLGSQKKALDVFGVFGVSVLNKNLEQTLESILQRKSLNPFKNPDFLNALNTL